MSDIKRKADHKDDQPTSSKHPNLTERPVVTYARVREAVNDILTHLDFPDDGESLAILGKYAPFYQEYNECHFEFASEYDIRIEVLHRIAVLMMFRQLGVVLLPEGVCVKLSCPPLQPTLATVIPEPEFVSRNDHITREIYHKVGPMLIPSGSDLGEEHQVLRHRAVLPGSLIKLDDVKLLSALQSIAQEPEIRFDSFKFEIFAGNMDRPGIERYFVMRRPGPHSLPAASFETESVTELQVYGYQNGIWYHVMDLPQLRDTLFPHMSTGNESPLGLLPPTPLPTVQGGDIVPHAASPPRHHRWTTENWNITDARPLSDDESEDELEEGEITK
jgi:hypothetical protein